MSAPVPGIVPRGLVLPRDWYLMPLLSVITVLLLFGTTEAAARKLFWATPPNFLDCLVQYDPLTGTRGIPNCVCSEKIFEGSVVEYRYNAHGDRAGVELQPKHPGVYRIVMVGSSVAEGLRVPREKTFASLLPLQLSKETGRKVELYNEGILWGTPHHVDLHFPDVLAAQPDLILWVLTKWDVDKVDEINAEGTGPNQTRWQHRSSANLMDAIRRARTVFMLKHLLYLSKSQYVKQYLLDRDAAAYLRTEPAGNWTTHMQHFERYVASISAKANAAGVPFAVAVSPERAEIAMIAMHRWPPGYDPHRFGAQVRAVVEHYGGRYVDILPGFDSIPDPQQNYYPIDTHPTAAGHAVLTRLLAQGLTAGIVSGLNRPPAVSSRALAPPPPTP